MTKPNTYIEQDQIDLLAEGELSSDERLRLFERFELDPAGWKRCAMALLESRALQVSLPPAQIDRILGVPGQTNSQNGPMQLARPTHATRWVLAASILLSLALGVSMGRTWAQATTLDSAKSNPVDSAKQNPDNASMSIVDLQVHDRDLLLQYQVAVRSTGAADSKLLAFFGTRENGKPKIIPIIESKTLENQLAKLNAPAVSSRKARDLARRGWQVNSQRQFVSIGTRDGGRKTIPIGMVNYKFVGRETF